MKKMRKFRAQELIESIHEIRFDNLGGRLFIYLILIDFILILFHIYSAATGYSLKSLFSIDSDRGYAEVFQYIKEFWIALSLVYLAKKHKAPVLFLWSLLFVFFMLTDSLKIHEAAGLMLAENLNLPALLGLRGRDIGELLFAFLLGGWFVVMIAITHNRSQRFIQSFSTALLFLLAALVAFGVVADALHRVFENLVDIRGVGLLLVLLEDGGEMIVMSFIAFVVFRFDPRIPDYIEGENNQ